MLGPPSGNDSGADSKGTGSSGDSAIQSGSEGGTDTGSAGDGGASGSCTPDPLRTGLTAQQTGVSVDAFDCPILEWTAKYGEDGTRRREEEKL
jgi:hypothetical protein